MLDVQAIDVFYGLVPALKGVSLAVGKGETVCLLGPNGAGKTTTVKSIVGLLKPRAGRVSLDGRDITGLPPHHTVSQGISLAPEGRLLFPDMSVEENLELGAAPARARAGKRATMCWPSPWTTGRPAPSTTTGGKRSGPTRRAVAQLERLGYRVTLEPAA